MQSSSPLPFQEQICLVALELLLATGRVTAPEGARTDEPFSLPGSPGLTLLSVSLLLAVV